MTAGRALALLGVITGTLALVVQFIISMQAQLAFGRDLPGALGTFFSFYTILTNMVLVLIYLSELVPVSWLDLFRHPLVRAMMAANIALVMSFVYFVLRHLSTLTGLDLLCDYALHYATPIIYLLWWVIGARHGAVRWNNIPLMLAPTLVYLIYVLARGAWVQQYPYPILDVAEHGYGGVLINALFMTVALAVLMALAVGIDMALGKRSVANG